MVELRATYISVNKLFLPYAEQPFCDTPNAPKPPLCADRAIVIKVGKLSGDIKTGLDLSDTLIRAGNNAAENITNLRKQLSAFTTEVNTARGQ